MQLIWIAGLVVGGAVAAFAAVTLWFLRRVAKQGFANLPSRITLTPLADPGWKERAKMDQAVRSLESAGFTEVGAFHVPEFGLNLRGFVQEVNCLAAVVYEHPAAGLWTDVVLQYENGDGFTVSNAPHGEELEARPGQVKVINAAMTVDDLLRTAAFRLGSAPCKQLTRENFAETVSKAYALDYDWRKQRGGVKVREVVRVMEKLERAQSPLPCVQTGDCPYEYDKGSDRDIEGMPFPKRPRDPRACPKYGHLCPVSMEECGLAVEDLEIRAAIHCGSLADTLIEQGQLPRDSPEYAKLMERLRGVAERFPQDRFPQYYR